VFFLSRSVCGALEVFGGLEVAGGFGAAATLLDGVGVEKLLKGITGERDRGGGTGDGVVALGPLVGIQIGAGGLLGGFLKGALLRFETSGG